MMDLVRNLSDVFLHLDKNLNLWAASMGGWLYVVLFLIVFCETGLLILPFLPGDSLLFAVGALASGDGSSINLPLAGVLLSIAAVVGDAMNYSIGYRLGPKVFRSRSSRFLNQKHLQHAQAFYQRHGGKTIILARFVPIIRTFAPFVAGVGQMSYRRFALFNVIGGVGWVASLMAAGYYFGQAPFVKDHFELVVVAIVVISVLPAVFEFVRARRSKKTKPALLSVAEVQ